MTDKIDPKSRMHSAEHLLNQTMVRMFGCGRCFSAHIEKKKSKCDYRFDRPLTLEEIKNIEAQVNTVIKSDLPILEEYLSREEARKYFNLERLPDNTGDELRIIRIGDYDACPCVGFHVNSTGDIGEFRIISSSFDNDVLRLRYKLGPPVKER
jgi:misacylated tRNA(Ala) deacylase